MTEQEEAPPQVAEREIIFRGRKIWVRMPSPEALLVWKRTLTLLQAADVANWNGEQVLAILERTRKIIDSVILNRADIDWLDDQMLDGEITLKGTAEIITLTVTAFAPDDNRTSRRAALKTTPAKKAVRKRATT